MSAISMRRGSISIFASLSARTGRWNGCLSFWKIIYSEQQKIVFGVRYTYDLPDIKLETDDTGITARLPETVDSKESKALQSLSTCDYYGERI